MADSPIQWRYVLFAFMAGMAATTVWLEVTI